MLGVNTSTIWYVDAVEPTAVLREAEPDRGAAEALVARLHPGLETTYLGDESLTNATRLETEAVVVGWYPGVVVVRTGESLPPVPSSLVEHWVHQPGFRHTYLVSASSPTKAGSWGAFAHWDEGRLKRSFSATPVHIIEDVGLPQVWERPFWAGEHPAPPSLDVLPDPQTLPFAPREFAEAATATWLGADLDPATITVSRFAVHPAGQVPEWVQRLERERAEQRRIESELVERERAEQERVAQERAVQEQARRGARTERPPQRRSLFARLFRRDT